MPPTRPTEPAVGQNGVVASSGEERYLRPFWLHQAAEYVIGLVLVAAGLQSPTPMFPALAGGLIMLNAAIVEGPLGAFRLVPRMVHRWVDVVVIALIVITAALPFLEIDNTSRMLMLVMSTVLAFVWWNSRFQPVVKPVGIPIDRADAVGRLAGRAVGGVARAVRNRKSP